MGVLRSAGRAATSVVALLGVVLGAQSAFAAGVGRTSATQTLGSASWGVVATTAAVPPYANAPLNLPFGVSGVLVSYLDVVNVGQTTLTGTTYSLSGSNLPGSATVGLYACVGGTWNQLTGTCSGTVTTIVTSLGATTSVATSAVGTYPANAGSRITLAGILSKSNANTAATVGVSVTRSSQVAAPRTTNS